MGEALWILGQRGQGRSICIQEQGNQIMQQVKTYISKFFKGEARDQFARDVKKMAKQGWHLHTLTDEGVGEGQRHTGRLVAVYEK
jgi:hypothetical protein